MKFTGIDKNDALTAKEKRLIGMIWPLESKQGEFPDLVKRRSSSEFDLEISGTHHVPDKKPYGFSAWLPLTAIRRLVTWNCSPIAELTDYPEMALASDWSAVRDSSDEKIWTIFYGFVFSSLAGREVEPPKPGGNLALLQSFRNYIDSCIEQTTETTLVRPKSFDEWYNETCLKMESHTSRLPIRPLASPEFDPDMGL